MSNQTFSIWDGSVASSFGGGTGTEANPYLINSAAQLAYLAEVFNDPDVKKNKNTYYSKYYKLTSNIDLDKREWTPIGCIGIPDYGNCAIFFDGDNHIVRGLFIDRPEDKHIGLFGYTDNLSVIKNLAIEDGFVSGNQNVGGIVGKFTNDSNSIIENCSFSGEVQGYQFTGGLVGSGRGKLLKDCTNSGTICTNSYAGGIAGRFYGGADCEIINCVNTGTITSSGSSGGIVGCNQSLDIPFFKYCRNAGDIINGQGITGGDGNFEYCSNAGNIWGRGGINGWLYKGYMKNCHNSGTIDANEGKCIGGLTGYATYATIESCTNTGTVNGIALETGGICGKSEKNSTIEYCTNEGAVNSSSDRVGGIVGTGNHVLQCHNTGHVKGNSYVAGICGYSDSEDSLIAGCVNDGFIEATWGGAGIAGNCKGTIQNCINMASIQATKHGAAGIVYQGGIAVKNCYNTGSLTGPYLLGGIIGSTLAEGFIFEKNYNSGEFGSVSSTGGILGELYHDGGQIIDCHYHAGSAQKGIGYRPYSVKSDPIGYVDSIVSADNPKTVPAMLTQSIVANTVLATLSSFWSKKKLQHLTQISKLVSISKSLGVGQDEEPLNEIAGDDMYIVTEHTPVREATDTNSNIIALSFKKDLVKVLPQTRSVQEDYYRINTEEGQVGLILATSLRPANTQGKGNTTYVVKAAQLAFREYPSRSYGGSLETLSYGDKVQSVPNEKNEEYIEKVDNEYWIKVSFNETITGWVLVRFLRKDTGEAPYEIYKLRLKSDVTDAPDGIPIASLIRGNTVNVVLPEETKPGKSDTWIKIFYDKAFRWIMKDDLEKSPEGSGQSVQINNWLTGYTVPSKSGGRDAYAANLPSIFKDWYAYEKLAGIGKWTLMEYPNLIATPGSDGELLDENGYYWIAVGPRIINKQYDDNGNLTVSKNHNAQNILVMGKCADVVLEHISTGDTVYLYCRIGDVKAHTWIGKGDSQNGLSQTGVPYPNNASGEAADLNSADGSTVEFMGHPTYKSNGDPDNRDMSKYRLLKIIVHD